MLEEPDFSNSIAAKTINKKSETMIIIPMVLKSTKPLFLSVYVLPKNLHQLQKYNKSRLNSET
jgi:hypothetical protein